MNSIDNRSVSYVHEYYWTLIATLGFEATRENKSINFELILAPLKDEVQNTC